MLLLLLLRLWGGRGLIRVWSLEKARDIHLDGSESSIPSELTDHLRERTCRTGVRY